MKLRKLIGYSVTTALALGLSSISQAAVITSFEASGIVSNQVGLSTITFEGLGSHDGTNACAYTSCTGNFEVRENTDGHVHGSAPPFTATPIDGHWLTVPNDLSSGSATFTLGSSYDYFGLFWGSIDTYNSITFFDGATQLASFSGSHFIPDLEADGGQTDWNSNRFINFSFTDGDTFDSFKLTSNGLAFETDNHAYGNVSVPEPSVIALMGLGLAGIGFARRRRTQA